MVNHRVAITGAVERYVLTSCIRESPSVFIFKFELKLIEHSK